jgi:prepilin-type processing-associated H-X9-DG protein
MKTGKGVRISSCHRGRVQVLFADGVVRQLPSQMPLSLWRKILNEGIDDFDKLEDQIDPDAPDMIDVSVQHQTTDENIFPQLLSIGVWLFSIVWLFACAIQSRKITPQASADAV